MEGVVLMGDPRVAAVPVLENREPLVDASVSFAFSAMKSAEDTDRRRLRTAVLDRLVVARASLPPGVHLLLVEGHRRQELQSHHFDHYRAGLIAADPALTEADSHLRASRYVSPPGVAPHVSGAAIDLTLCDDSGTELDLGTPVNASPEESRGACYFAADVEAEARRLRFVLASALEGAGLVNYPTEWWHWSYGDRYWALATGAPAAVYGPLS